MASISKLSTPTGILRRRPSVEMSGKTSVARLRDNDIHLGSPTSRTGVHFAAPDNLTDLLLRLATCDKEQPLYRKVKLFNELVFKFLFINSLVNLFNLRRLTNDI